MCGISPGILVNFGVGIGILNVSVLIFSIASLMCYERYTVKDVNETHETTHSVNAVKIKIPEEF